MKYIDTIIDSAEIITSELIEKIEAIRGGCKSLGIGIYSDEHFAEVFHRKPIRPYVERAMVVSYLKGVDFVFKVEDEKELCIQKEDFCYENNKIKKYHIGYAPGTYDLLHQGHLEHLTEAYSQCEILVVGINDDNLVKSYKNKTPLMSAIERANIVSKLNFVSAVYIADTLERKAANEWITKKFGSPIDAVFIGSDWQGQDLHNDENLKIVFTYRDPEVAKTRCSTYFRQQLLKNAELMKKKE